MDRPDRRQLRRQHERKFGKLNTARIYEAIDWLRDLGRPLGPEEFNEACDRYDVLFEHLGPILVDRMQAEDRRTTAEKVDELAAHGIDYTIAAGCTRVIDELCVLTDKHKRPQDGADGPTLAEAAAREGVTLEQLCEKHGVTLKHYTRMFAAFAGGRLPDALGH